MRAPQHNPPIASALPWRRTPAELIARWPADRALFALSSAGDATGMRRSRWTILAEPSAHTLRLAGADPLAELDEAIEQTGSSVGLPLPFVGGWIGWMGYELGAAIEPAVGQAQLRQSSLGRLAWCPAALLFDHLKGSWWAAGRPDAVAGLVATAEEAAVPSDPAWIAGELRSAVGAESYRNAVARAVELIHAGDVFQVNLAHQMGASFEGSPRALFLRLLDGAAPDHGALLEWRHATGDEPRAVISISPELFLQADLAAGGDGRVVTRPIKGTRAAQRGAEADLSASAKDAAELIMIVDLMRNDLGRVCEYGSVRVDAPRDLEVHAGGTLLHAAATVSGRLRPGTRPSDLLRATFPPGSVTGAPKVRAMQIIRDLEAEPRGVYCGAIGYFSDHGPAMLNVAIRTASLYAAAEPARWDQLCGRMIYPVGAGIVAESDPESEWSETLAKAGAFSEALASSPTLAEPHAP